MCLFFFHQFSQVFSIADLPPLQVETRVAEKLLEDPQCTPAKLLATRLRTSGRVVGESCLDFLKNNFVGGWEVLGILWNSGFEWVFSQLAFEF